jgi:hypothetical protein
MFIGKQLLGKFTGPKESSQESHHGGGVNRGEWERKYAFVHSGREKMQRRGEREEGDQNVWIMDYIGAFQRREAQPLGWKVQGRG